MNQSSGLTRESGSTSSSISETFLSVYTPDFSYYRGILNEYLCTYFNAELDGDVIYNLKKCVWGWNSDCKIHANIDQVPATAIADMRQISYIFCKEYIEYMSKTRSYQLLPDVHAEDLPTSCFIGEKFLSYRINYYKYTDTYL